MSVIDLTNGMLAVRPASGPDRKFLVPSPLITIPDSIVTNDVILAIPLKKGWLVKGTKEKFAVAGVGGTITLDVGIVSYDGTTLTEIDYNGLDAAISGKTTAGSVLQSTPSDAYPAAGGYYVATDDLYFIAILANSIVSAITTEPQLRIYADIEDLS